jgi:hypothetical protein
MNASDALEYLASYGVLPDCELALKISVGLEKVLELIERETFPFLRAGGSELRFFEGAYGRGKTHLLKAIEAVARRNGFVTAYVECNCGKRPFASLDETYRQVVAAVRSPRAASLGKASGPHNLILESFQGQPKTEALRRLARVREDPWLTRDFRNLIYAYGKRLCDIQGPDPIRTELAKLIRANVAEPVRLTDIYRAEKALPRPLGKLSRRNAGSWLRSLSSLPTALGYSGLIVLFDETEQNFPFSAYSRTHFANLRNLVDHVAAGDLRGCAIYYAVVDDFLDTARLYLDALAQRIERVRIDALPGSNANLRAVWCSVDEVTEPRPPSEEFYKGLRDRLLDLTAESGFPRDRIAELRKRLGGAVREFATRADPGAVREFVRKTAESILDVGEKRQ